MKLFKDIKFKAHRNPYAKGVQGSLDLGDGLELSVVQGESLYGSAEDGDDEIAVFNNNENKTMEIDGEEIDMGSAFVPLSRYDDVLGWQTPDEIDVIITEIQNDPQKFLKKKQEEKQEYLDSLNED